MKQRNPALDMIRIFAFLCVVGIHFFLNNNFYNIPVTGLPMAGMISVRCFCTICIPLFLMLSGYLLKEKTLSRKYYSRIIYILAIYLLSGMACGIYKILFMDLSVAAAIAGIFDFQTASYSWYVEMYIGLFLLIPFLNMMYRGAEAQGKGKHLVLTFLIVTALPSLLNVWDLRGLVGIVPADNEIHVDPLVPDYWKAIYPVTFYFLGAYLRDYPLKLKPRVNLLLILLATLVFGMVNYFRSYGRSFLGLSCADYRSVWCTGLSILVFSFLTERQWTSVGPRTARFLSKVSTWTLGAYLCSEIFDRIVYGILMEQGYPMLKRMALFPLTVGTVFLCSMTLSALLNGIYNGISSLFRKKEKTT